MAGDDLPPPSYATRPPPGHRSGPSKSRQGAPNPDSEDEDGQLLKKAQASRPKRRVAEPEESAHSRAYFPDEGELNDSYCPANGKGESHYPPYSDEEVSGDEKYSGKGKGRTRHTHYPDESDGGHDPNGEEIGRALVLRKDTRPDNGAGIFSGRDTDRRRWRDRDDGSDHGGERRYVSGNREGSEVLVRTRDIPRGLREAARPHSRERDEDDDMIKVKRYSNLSYREIPPHVLRVILSIFEIPPSTVRSFCETGKIRWDAKEEKLCLDRIYPLFPSYMAARFDHFWEETRGMMEEEQIHGRKTIVRTEYVPVHNVHEPFYDPYEGLYYDDGDTFY